MLLKDVKSNEYKVVLGYYENTENSIIYITYDYYRKMADFIHEDDVKIVDNTYSKTWIKNENDCLPQKWYQTNFLYELSDDLSPLDNILFKEIKEIIVDQEFDYYLLENEIIPRYTANTIGDRWLLCAECDHAFEIIQNPIKIKCPNIACNIIMINPLYDLELDRIDIPITFKTK